MARNRIYAIDVGSHSVKVAEVTRTASGFRVTKVGSADVPPDARNGDGIVHAIHHALGEAGHRRGSCVVALPRSQVVTRRLANLPTTKESAGLRDIVKLQAETELPFDAGAAVFDYYDVRDTGSGTSVELAAVRRNDVEDLLESVRHSGAKPTVVIPAVFGIAALARIHQNALGVQRRLMVLNVGGSSTDVVIMRGDYFGFSRNFPVGTELFEKDPNSAVIRLREELSRTIQAYRRDLLSNGQEQLDEVWLWGGGATTTFLGTEDNEVSLASIIEQELGYPTRVWSDVQGFEDTAGLEDAKLGWARFGIAVGLAAGVVDGTLTLNLLPHEEKQKKERLAQRTQLIIYAAASLVIVTGLTYASQRLREHQEDQIAELDTQLATYQPVRARTNVVTNDLKAMAEVAEPHASVLDIVRELTALMPERRDLAMTQLSIEKNGKVTVNIEGNNHDLVSQAVTRMGKSPWFTDVRPGQISVVEQQGKQTRQLSVALKVVDDADVLSIKQVGTPVEAGPPVAQAGGGPGGQFPQMGGPQGSGGRGNRGGRGGRSGGENNQGTPMPFQGAAPVMMNQPNVKTFVGGSPGGNAKSSASVSGEKTEVNFTSTGSGGSVRAVRVSNAAAQQQDDEKAESAPPPPESNDND